MSTLFAGPSLPMHNRAQFGWMPLHSAAFRGTPASQAPLPTLFSVDEFKLGKCPVRGFLICVAWALGIFFTAFLLRSGHCNRVSLPVVARAFSLFSAPNPSPQCVYGKYVGFHWLAVTAPGWMPFSGLSGLRIAHGCCPHPHLCWRV